MLTLRKHRKIIAMLNKQVARLELTHTATAALVGFSGKSLYSWRTDRRRMSRLASWRVVAAAVVMRDVVIPKGVMSAERRRVLIARQLKGGM